MAANTSAAMSGKQLSRRFNNTIPVLDFGTGIEVTKKCQNPKWPFKKKRNAHRRT